MTLTRQQRRAARLIAAGFPQDQVAARVGCATRTIRSWKHDLPAFTLLIEQERTDMVDPSPRDALLDLLYAEDERVRLGAAQALLKIPGLPEEAAEAAHTTVTLHDFQATK